MRSLGNRAFLHHSVHASWILGMHSSGIDRHDSVARIVLRIDGLHPSAIPRIASVARHHRTVGRSVLAHHNACAGVRRQLSERSGNHRCESCYKNKLFHLIGIIGRTECAMIQSNFGMQPDCSPATYHLAYGNTRNRSAPTATESQKYNKIARLSNKKIKKLRPSLKDKDTGRLLQLIIINE